MIETKTQMVPLKKGGGICTYLKEGTICNELTDLTCLDEGIEMTVIRYKLSFTRYIYIVKLLKLSLNICNYVFLQLAKTGTVVFLLAVIMI